MFKLVQFSSPSGLFDSITFKDGLNVILGKYSRSDINGIGKTSIVQLIDYCLLASYPKSIFFKEEFLFLKNHSIRLDFSIDQKSYTIIRGFHSRSTALFYEEGKAENEYEDVELRMLLGKLIFSSDSYQGIYDSSWYRTIMSFFVQSDHEFIQRSEKDVTKFVRGNHRKSELFIYNFFLLGIDNTNIWKFDDTRVELLELRDEKAAALKRIQVESGKDNLELVRADVEYSQVKLSEFESSLKAFEFKPIYDDLESRVVEINKEISSLRRAHYKARSKYKQILESLEVDIDVNTDEVARVYSELNQEFAAFVKKNLDEVIEFRKNISSNRSIYLNKRKKMYDYELSKLDENIEQLERKRTKLFQQLEERKAFDSIRTSYESILASKASLDSKKILVDQFDSIEKEIAHKSNEISAIVSDIVEQQQDLLNDISEVKSLFVEIAENSVDTENSDVKPYFSIQTRTHATSPVQVVLEIPRSASLGKGRFKLLAYDLSIFLALCGGQRKAPCFLIHDGVFHGIAHETRIKYLNYLNGKLSSLEGAQYIVTLNEDEILVPDDLAGSESENLNFKLSDVVIVQLSDTPSNMFFGNEFG